MELSRVQRFALKALGVLAAGAATGAFAWWIDANTRYEPPWTAINVVLVLVLCAWLLLRESGIEGPWSER